MKLGQLGLWAAAGMLVSSSTVYLLTSGDSHAESAPSEAKAMLAAAVVPAGEDAVGGEAPDEPAGPGPHLVTNGTLNVEGRMSHARLLKGQSGTVYLMLEVTGAETSAGKRTPVSMALVLDNSGSMAGARLAHAQAAARGVVERLADGDMVSVISFDTQTHLVAAPTRVSEVTRPGLMSAISGIAPGGDTCISCGISEARRQLATIAASDMPQQIIVLSDGKTNNGVRDIEGLRQLALLSGQAGEPITTVGVGLDYDEQKLQAIAESSNGRHHFVDNDASLATLFQAETDSLVHTVATDTRVELTLANGVDLVKVHDRTFDSQGASRVSVALGALSAGEVKTLLVELRVPTTSLGTLSVADVTIAFDDPVSHGRVETRGSLGLEIAPADATPVAMDPVVQARLERSRTSSTLEQVNVLLRGGHVEEARAALDKRVAELSSASALYQAGEKAGDDYGSQLQSTTRAQQGIAEKKPSPGGHKQKGPCGCAGDDLQCSTRCSQYENNDDALELRR